MISLSFEQSKNLIPIWPTYHITAAVGLQIAELVILFYIDKII